MDARKNNCRVGGNADPNAVNYFDFVKRIIGADPKFNLREFARNVGYKVEMQHRGPTIMPDLEPKIVDRWIRPEEIAGYIVEELLKLANARCGKPVQRCVITVPANFSDNQKKATLDACTLAANDQGIKVMRMISEPTAAALSYNLHKGEACNALVFDFGGGTLDVTCLAASEGMIDVMATAGDN